ncbi:N-acetylneuraminate 9-O-acetyltransferase-like [Palaemon carinicauda]|uniref:N-acetylneuraminate 9-O-acetyltransferase-like n=1 Tax=Palaemon carinicauda TaxID=392227 RepID=UPI0035B5DE7F
MLSSIKQIIQATSNKGFKWTMLLKSKHRTSNEIIKLCGLAIAFTFIFFQAVLILQGFSTTPPVLKQSCYRESQDPTEFPINMCCQMYNYSKKDFFRCNTKIQETQQITRQITERNFPLEGSTNSTAHKRTTWVLIGDSRVRQIFSAFVSLLSGPRLKYKKPSTLGKWRSIHELTESLRIGKLHEDIEVNHLDYFVNLKFYWDPKLQRLPKLLKEWASNESDRPFVVFLGSGLHWMRQSIHAYHTSGLQSAASSFQMHMEKLYPQIENIASSINTIIQLLDPVQETAIFPKYKGIYSNENVQIYNQIITSIFSKSNAIIWDSNIPITNHYFRQCQIKNRQSYDKLWDCGNPLHPGFIAIEKSLNMLLNGICNKFLKINELYC